jgi:hypothetical protein
MPRRDVDSLRRRSREIAARFQEIEARLPLATGAEEAALIEEAFALGHEVKALVDAQRAAHAAGRCPCCSPIRGERTLN